MTTFCLLATTVEKPGEVFLGGVGLPPGLHHLSPGGSWSQRGEIHHLQPDLSELDLSQ